ncbi:TetR/AcrR family transcriptional regulator [Rhodobacter sp. KR11]|uniref:TetR/AcrR family transcriptional regulator n=1 Tax=Rhodobacter sp. KR11 TaxID=2974588 RepID=UPI0022218878|nr:TetR/AcrR family transcriptional regulator [Rhodobacter sp. KR11]MCW1920749.1 TetR/AcrR family transcriptional regulator [Rhodobacter sp. KR11]
MEQTQTRKTGRPLSFDRQEALRQAMLTFWRHGYETTSVSDLTRAMGITAPSLYTAFGDKRRLFLESVQLYAQPPEALQAQLDAATSARAVARQMLTAAVHGFTGQGTPPGCLLASATASGSTEAAEVQAAVAAIRADILARLTRRFADLGTQSEALAGTLVALIQGLSVLARDGQSRQALLAITETVLPLFPEAGT